MCKASYQNKIAISFQQACRILKCLFDVSATITSVVRFRLMWSLYWVGALELFPVLWCPCPWYASWSADVFTVPLLSPKRTNCLDISIITTLVCKFDVMENSFPLICEYILIVAIHICYYLNISVFSNSFINSLNVFLNISGTNLCWWSSTHRQ